MNSRQPMDAQSRALLESVIKSKEESLAAVEKSLATYLEMRRADDEAREGAGLDTADAPSPARELDPLPFVNYYHWDDRYAGHVLPGGLCTFMPRAEYEQDQSKYPRGQREK